MRTREELLVELRLWADPGPVFKSALIDNRTEGDRIRMRLLGEAADMLIADSRAHLRKLADRIESGEVEVPK